MEGSSRVLFSPILGLEGLADPGRTVVLTDSVVRRHVPREYPDGRIVEIPQGEAAKSMDCLAEVYARFLELGLGRGGTVLAVGGGSVSDLAGFAASTWMRGVDFGFAPTTVLAMVDASVGGKNGIDFGGYKNLVGTFRLPRFVLVDTSLLATLPAREAASGLVEAVKHAVIEGPDHMALLERAIPSRPEGVPFALPDDPEALAEVIARSVRLKAGIAAADFRDEGERRLLNLGHTAGHAVEAVTGLPHGECVAAGLSFALGLAVRRGGSVEGARRVLDLLGRLGVPKSLEEARLAASSSYRCAAAAALKSSAPDPAVLEDPASFRAAAAGALRADKNRTGGTVSFALPLAPGSVEIIALGLEEIRAYMREAP
ncbi:MAG TPA: 3-dehydroquinate synthase family protein [Magnetospirillaceae bacterium]|nr:3-dehydroquinate synthase family protein [Magnetospirillaceae bacterium]